MPHQPPAPATRFGSGRAVLRTEDDALLRGAGRFTDDLGQGGDGIAVFLRSPYAHAALRAITVDAARAMPGVRGIFTGADLVAAEVPPLDDVGAAFKRADGSPCATPPQHVLAVDVVRYVGEPVALVVADTPAQAQDAAEAMDVDYAELPAVPDLDAALRAEHSVWPQAPDNIACESRHGDADAAAATFARAAHVVRMDLEHQRVSPLTLEPRAIRARWDAATQRADIWVCSQMPTGLRAAAARVLGLAPEAVRVRVGDVGGGFGMKMPAYPEYLAITWATRVLGCPVRWMASRSEEFISAYPGRDQRAHLELALDTDGRILALRVHSRANVGAYARSTGVGIPLLIGPWVQTSVYDIPLIDFHFQACLSNQAPTGAYRGAGRPEAIYNIERLMDQAARELGIDRLALRRRNFIRPEQMPYTNPMKQTYDTGRFEHVLDQVLPLADWRGFEARAAESALRGLWRGLGLATFLEWTGGNVFKESVTVDVRGDGVIEVFAAVNQMGQGIATSLAQLVVDVFDVPIGQVRVVLGDTDRGNGFGSAGSRSLFTGGSAMHAGAEHGLQRARALAAEALEAAPQDLRYHGGRFVISGTDREMGLFELAGRQPDGRIFVAHTHTVDGPTWPNGAHVSEVEVDPQTGTVQVVAYASVNDIGRVVNPAIVRGQLDGGAMQGLGQALMECMVYDPQTGQPLTGSLMDYAAPRADDLHALFRTELDESTPCKNNALGVKGVGELGTIGAAPCVVNAVADALARNGRADLAPRVQMPVTPARLWQLLQSA